ncbi:toxin Bro [Selenomonas sp. oral taxon 126]|uniref:BRO-N domain-containing protein n=1 Tax=Selenomonas sp. oral taxon 126 TaxID=712528 RepID=UPI0008078324|nr:Bro-N domain-containing protein [Selenomonas sp. oral taxon 126]ANR70124.1 toxin Bro [Selenomonas sp. oral taxon 126]DAF19086.1 MAG TPA: repressor domain protein [Caudoviricetes sp.]
MANEVQIFENAEFGKVRTIVKDGEPYFVGKDVADILGYAKPENAIATHVDEEDKTSTLIQGTGSNYKSKAVIINESGVYALIFGSKLPKAKQFKRWVTSEVLPSIRKTGSYNTIPKERSEFKEQELKARMLNARVRESNQYLKIAAQIDIPEYRYILQAKSAEALNGGVPVLPLQEVERKTYSATEIGAMFGVSANKIGKLANAHKLKTPEYGKLFYSKSEHSVKEVETWRYYESVIPVFEKIFGREAA